MAWLIPGSVPISRPTCWNEPVSGKPCGISTSMGTGKTWLLALSHPSVALAAQFNGDRSLGPWSSWWATPTLSLLTAPLSTASIAPMLPLLLTVFLHHFTLLSSQRLGCVHCSSVITIRNALLDIINSYPASPFRVTNSCSHQVVVEHHMFPHSVHSW